MWSWSTPLTGWGARLPLIGCQALKATRVAGFRTWQSLGRQVRKRERGIAIMLAALVEVAVLEREAFSRRTGKVVQP